MIGSGVLPRCTYCRAGAARELHDWQQPHAVKTTVDVEHADTTLLQEAADGNLLDKAASYLRDLGRDKTSSKADGYFDAMEARARRELAYWRSTVSSIMPPNAAILFAFPNRCFLGRTSFITWQWLQSLRTHCCEHLEPLWSFCKARHSFHPIRHALFVLNMRGLLHAGYCSRLRRDNSAGTSAVWCVSHRRSAVSVCVRTMYSRAAMSQGAAGVFQQYYGVVKDVTMNGLAVAETKLRGELQ